MSNLSKNELRKLSYINPQVGRQITDVIEEMVRRADIYDIRVTCVFNGAQFTVEPGISIDGAYELWDAEMDHRSEKYSKSTKAEVSRREFEERKAREVIRKQEVLSMVEQEEVEVPSHKREDFNEAVRTSSVDGYNLVIINFAMAWAVAMQRAMRNDEKIEDIADKLSYYVDYFGISGYGYGCAVTFLATYWKHGEELRRWHNLSLGNVGVLANEQQGVVLNPAIISLRV